MKFNVSQYRVKRRQISILPIMIALLLQSCSADICSDYCSLDKCKVDCYDASGKLISKIRTDDVTITSCSYDTASRVFSYSFSRGEFSGTFFYDGCYPRSGDQGTLFYSGSKTKENKYETSYIGNVLYMTKYLNTAKKDTRITYRWDKDGWVLDNIILNKFFETYNSRIPIKFYDYIGNAPQSAKMLTYPFNEYSWTGEDFIITKFGR